MTTGNFLVNPQALQNCFIQHDALKSKILDISFVRLIIELSEDWLEFLETNLQFKVQFQLDTNAFEGVVSLEGKGAHWARLKIDEILPSARTRLRGFLSPRKIGESIIEDWRTENIRHFHGLNESEIWVGNDGEFTFLYLDQQVFDTQFIARLREPGGSLRTGLIKRQDYLEKMDMTSELPIERLDDRAIYGRLTECRDILTNFRATGQSEFQLKQRLLKIVSDTLYSSPRRIPPAEPPVVRTSAY